MNIPLNINWQQILLHLFNFAILGGGLYFLLYKPVKDFMAKRTAHYEELDKAAQDKIAQAEALNEQYNEKLRHAEEEIRLERTQAQQSAQQAAQQRLEEAHTQAEAILNDARKAAQRSRDRALQDSRKELQELAVEAARKLVLESSEDALDQFLTASEEGGIHARKKR